MTRTCILSPETTSSLDSTDGALFLVQHTCCIPRHKKYSDSGKIACFWSSTPVVSPDIKYTVTVVGSHTSQHNHKQTKSGRENVVEVAKERKEKVEERQGKEETRERENNCAGGKTNEKREENHDARMIMITALTQSKLPHNP